VVLARPDELDHELPELVVLGQAGHLEPLGREAGGREVGDALLPARRLVAVAHPAQVLAFLELVLFQVGLRPADRVGDLVVPLDGQDLHGSLPKYLRITASYRGLQGAESEKEARETTADDGPAAATVPSSAAF